MPRKFFKRYTPDPEWVKRQHSMRLLGSWLHDPNIWHLNRRSVANACFIGVFVAFIPLPLQMAIAAALAIMARANMALSVALVWITNPLTMAPVFFLAYKVGAAVLGRSRGEFDFELSLDWLSYGLVHNWQPFLLGCLLCGLFFGLLASTTINWAWRRHTIKRWHDRRLQRQQRP